MGTHFQISFFYVRLKPVGYVFCVYIYLFSFYAVLCFSDINININSIDKKNQ